MAADHPPLDKNSVVGQFCVPCANLYTFLGPPWVSDAAYWNSIVSKQLQWV